jgi:hypothetical protein
MTLQPLPHLNILIYEEFFLSLYHTIICVIVNIVIIFRAKVWIDSLFVAITTSPGTIGKLLNANFLPNTCTTYCRLFQAPTTFLNSTTE